MSSPTDFGPSAAASARTISDPVEATLALRARGRPEEALALLPADGPFSSDLYTLRGDLQLELGQLEEAAGSYRAVTSAEPGNVYAYSNLALCLHRLGRWKAAAEACEKTLELDPHRDQVRIAYGDCLLRLNRFEEALACFDLCWSESAREQALFGKAVALQLLRRFDHAETHYNRLLAIHPNAEEALSNLIAMSMDVFDLERVLRYSSRLLEVCPQSQAALQGLIVVAVERREYATAARYFARLEERQPESLAPGKEGGEEECTEYRLSREVLDRLDLTWRKTLAPTTTQQR